MAAVVAIALVFLAAAMDCFLDRAEAEAFGATAYSAAAAPASSFGGVSGTGPEIPKFSSRSRSLRSLRNFLAKSAIYGDNNAKALAMSMKGMEEFETPNIRIVALLFLGQKGKYAPVRSEILLS